MATAYTILLSTKDVGNFQQGGYRSASYEKASEVLQHNLENWDIIFSGLRHNHIVHCILTMLGLGATPAELQMAYERESSYQRQRPPIDEEIVAAMANRAEFETYLSQQPQYSNFLLFFQRQIEANGVKATLEEHLFAGDEHANRLLALFFGGIFHPYIHLGYAFEYNQPAIVAEALAMACVHEVDPNKMAPVYIGADKLSREKRQHEKKAFRDIMEDLRQDSDLQTSIDGDNSIDRSKNVVTNATNIMVKHAAEYSISDSDLEQRMYEMFDICPLLIATKPSPIAGDQQHKIDFFLLHSVNTLAMMPSFVNHPWLSRSNSVRLLEWAGRCHLLNYVSQTAPPITTADIEHYPLKRNWDEMFRYSINHPSDDGHLQKCIRSLALGEKIVAGDNIQPGYMMRPELWIRLANLVVDLVPWGAKSSEERWLLFFTQH